MTSDAEIARNPHHPEGWRRDGIDFFVANSTPSRSPQTLPYLWSETPEVPNPKDAGLNPLRNVWYVVLQSF